MESINRFSIFDETDKGYSEVPLRLNGTELVWLEGKPGFSRSFETLVHAQRSRHQLKRNGFVQGCDPRYEAAGSGPSTEQGLHWATFNGISIDGLLGSEPAVEEGSVAGQLSFAPGAYSGSADLVWFRGFLEIEKAGVYWFRTAPGNRACLGIDRQLVLDQFTSGAVMQASIELEAGPHAIDARFLLSGGSAPPALQWVTPGLRRWRWQDVPASHLRLPAKGLHDE